MGSNVYAETGHDGSQKQLMTKDHAEHGKNGRHCGHHKEVIEGKIAVLQARQNLMTATTSATFDQTAVQRAFGDVSAAREKMIILRAKVFSEVMPILTPDQKAVVSGRLAKAKLRMQKAISKLESKLKSPTE